MDKLSTTFTPEVILSLKQDKTQITEELLEKLRSFGNEGKHIALDILNLETDAEQYHLDAYGGRCSFNGNRMLKKAFTKLQLSKIHELELQKCANDLHYFKDNYVKIKTQSGINFPEIRNYQNKFLDVLQPPENEAVVGLLSRQCCSASTTMTINNCDTTFGELFNECKEEYNKQR